MRNNKQEPGTFTFHPFEDLMQLVESRGLRLDAKPRTEIKDGPPDDERLFAEAMSAVREIREYRLLSVASKKTAPPAGNPSSAEEDVSVLREIVSGRVKVNLPDTQEYIEWLNEDYRGDITRRLHEGKYSVQDWLDLHGLCSEEAEIEVAGFLREALLKGHRCVKIIHGRGLRSPKGPVLKDSLVKWLSGRHRKHIIAFATARQCDGGLGALYVLLR